MARDFNNKGLTEARWWRQENDCVVCELCPRQCHIKEGKCGFCFVRENKGGKLFLMTYGRSTGFCIDPIEKKPLYHFYPGTSVLSFGTAGCNLGCKFCQNWDISKAREVELLSSLASPEAIVRSAQQNGCKSIAFTYNDPVIWAEYAIDTAKLAREVGIKTVAVTAGYISAAAREDFFSYVDAANVDLKAFSEDFYRAFTGAQLEPVLDTLRWLKRETDLWLEITTLLIPGENDSVVEVARLCDWVLSELGSDVPLHFSAFHPDYKLLDRPATPVQTLRRARSQAQKAGIKFCYVGNVEDHDGESTSCPRCLRLLIERKRYELSSYELQGNCCHFCGEKIPGVFEEKPGNWGQKRQRIVIS